jgi:hypothetical protein
LTSHSDMLSIIETIYKNSKLKNGKETLNGKTNLLIILSKQRKK